MNTMLATAVTTVDHGDGRRSVTAASAEACCQQCQLRAGCVGFTHVTKTMVSQKKKEHVQARTQGHALNLTHLALASAATHRSPLPPTDTAAARGTASMGTRLGPHASGFSVFREMVSGAA